jgi:hypothetical protein
MSRRRSATVDQRNAPVLARTQALKAEHPFWGYRRIWAQLHFGEGLAVQHPVLAFSHRLSDTVSGRAPTSQPQHSVRGRLTKG